MLIDTPQQLSSFCERAASSPILAVDTEFLREKTYYPTPCLLQVGTAEEQAVIDVIRLKDLDLLEELLFDRTVPKVIHACSQDLEVFVRLFGKIPEPIFDTQVAAAYAGYRMQIGYGPLVEAICGIHLPKSQSLTDWSRRPLDPMQVGYAEDDVRYLPAVYKCLMDKLVELDRLSWVLPEMQALSVNEVGGHDPASAYLHVKRIGTLTRTQLAVARELAAWRERKAAKRNIPRKWLLSDEVVIEISKLMPTTVERLRSIRGVVGLSEKDAHAVIVAVGLGKKCKPVDLPPVPKHRRSTPEEECVVDLMHAYMRVISEHTGIAGPLMASRDDLLDFMKDPESTKLSEGWREEVLGKPLRNLLAGQVGLTVKDNHVELL